MIASIVLFCCIVFATTGNCFEAPNAHISVYNANFNSIEVCLSWNSVEGADYYKVFGSNQDTTQVSDTTITFLIPTNWGFQTPAVIESFNVIAGGRAYYNGHHYAYIEDPMDWNGANITAWSMGSAHLAHIQSAEEQAFINEYLNGRIAMLGGSSVVGSWSWSWPIGWMPIPFTYTNWALGHPVDVRHYLINDENGQWQSINNPYTGMPFLVEWGNGIN